MSHQLALITSLPFVHTARRSYRLNGPVKSSDCWIGLGNLTYLREVAWTLSFRGRRSRNKVSVGEPAEGSLTRIHIQTCIDCELIFGSDHWLVAACCIACWLLVTSNLFLTIFLLNIKNILQLLAMDVSALATMKDAAKCDRRCEWQNSANQENAERILRFQVSPGSMFRWGHLYYNAVNYADFC